jgi:hypothetical protein
MESCTASWVPTYQLRRAPLDWRNRAGVTFFRIRSGLPADLSNPVPSVLRIFKALQSTFDSTQLTRSFHLILAHLIHTTHTPHG